MCFEDDWDLLDVCFIFFNFVGGNVGCAYVCLALFWICLEKRWEMCENALELIWTILGCV